MLACSEGAHRFRGDSSFKTYLLAIARTQLLMHLRKYARKGKKVDQLETSIADVLGSPSVVVAGKDEQKLVLTALREDLFPRLKEDHPGLQIALAGAQREQQESFAALGQSYVFALFVIFALLAVPFRSYVQPVIIMAVIPFGFVGAILGHVLMGYSLSIMSVFGLVALSGVVVNDSLVLIDAVNRERRRGKPSLTAVIDGGAMRLRPILLTSLTTFFGLVPMIAETSVQARFLIPMAISLGFGVLLVTFIVLLVVPALYMVIEDLRALIGVADTHGAELDEATPDWMPARVEPPDATSTYRGPPAQ
ncbi:MAG: efflux RND transporter permease subunit [Myxococcales bacterium]|nr:efflux RND transporter permease subunit [Myxococcales bacterium]